MHPGGAGWDESPGEILDASVMSQPPIESTCHLCSTHIPAGTAVFLPGEELGSKVLVLCRDCGDLDLEVDP